MSQTTLRSWADTPVRRRIIDFVAAVEAAGIPTADRIAVFDNDGTLWSEQPYYFQLAFALDRVRALAPHHPEWATTQPFRAVLENDFATLARGGMKSLATIAAASHTGMTTDEFNAIVRDWIAVARHPTTGLRYTQMIFRPMLELLDYLREYGFKIYIVSGGGIEFMRVFAEEIYGVPPEQVIGSSIETKYEMRESGPVLVRLPKLHFIDDKEGKPVAINTFIGRLPLLAFGNSDGDLQMLQWTAAGPGPRLMGLVHHTDGAREYAYDRKSHFGKLDKALDEARGRDWLIVDMQRDWLAVYPD